MPTISERIRSFFLGDEPIATKSAQTQAPYASVVRASLIGGQQTQRRGARMLREFADKCEPLRTAINWRKQQVGQGKWRVVRIDDPKRPPNPAVVSAVTKLLLTVNAKHESFRTLLDMVIEDLLVLDAGCIEKEKTIGGKITYLWGVDGATIAPDAAWDGRDPKADRYRQFIEGRLTASLRNDQLIYMMQTPTTHRLLGWSQVETLIQTIEAHLYGARYDFNMLKQSAPAGILDLGAGYTSQQVEAFRDYYESEIAGTENIAIIGGGAPGEGGAKFQPMAISPRDQMRDEYRNYLIGVISYVFQVDKTIFNIVGDVNRSTARSMSDRTDQGFAALARLVAEFVTREIIWEFDENHGFEFTDLSVVDPLAQAKVDQIYMQIGVTTPNQIRARNGEDPVPWGDVPYNATGTQTPDPLEDDPENDTPDDAKPGKDPSGKTESAKSIGPFFAG